MFEVRVVEFFGLPGAGKTTVAKKFVRLIENKGCAVYTTKDYILWLSKQSKFRKVWFMLTRTGMILGQLFWCLSFGLSLRPCSTFSITRVLLIPFHSVLFEEFLGTVGDGIVVLDQGDFQRFWSLGALSDVYSTLLLNRACQSMGELTSRQYICLVPDVAIAASRLLSRPASNSRFDHFNQCDVYARLATARVLVLVLRDIMNRLMLRVVEVDSSLPPDENAAFLVRCLENLEDNPRVYTVEKK